jgi:hypothetical protein
MSSVDWGALASQFERAVEAWQANEPLPPAAPFDMADLAAKLQAAQPEIDKYATIVADHPGAIAAADIMLAYFATLNEPWAAPIKTIVDALPGGLAAAHDKLPTIIWLLTTFAPAPGWEAGGTGYAPGPGPFRGR